MRVTATLIALLVFLEISTGQIILSSCNAPDSIRAKYNEDADRIALLKIYQQNLSYVDSITIPQNHSDTILNALIAVYNATSLPARDTVVTMLNIHTFPAVRINAIAVTADSSLNWMQQLKNGNIPTGNNTLDSLLTTYFMTIDRYDNWYGIMPTHTVYFKSDSNYNIPPLTSVFETVSGVSYADQVNTAGDGNDIVALIHADYVELNYIAGWGDCESGCTLERVWKFKVYFDCSVEFVGSYGNPLPLVTEVEKIKSTSISVYPNPFRDNLYLSKLNSIYHYSIYNTVGQELFHGQSSEYQITGLDLLPKGQYFLHIVADKQPGTFKLIKG